MTLFVTNLFMYWDLYALHVRRVSQLCYNGVDKFEQPIKNGVAARVIHPYVHGLN